MKIVDMMEKKFPNAYVVASVYIAASAFPFLSKFPGKLICCIAFGLASSASCLLKSIAINLLIS